eukprot:69635-Rhodomonas_salina.1
MGHGQRKLAHAYIVVWKCELNLRARRQISDTMFSQMLKSLQESKGTGRGTRRPFPTMDVGSESVR